MNEPRDVAVSYDRIADEYVQRIADELQYKPLDRQLLERLAAAVRDVGRVCEIGCGPGHVARYLHDQGVAVCGVDLSEEMVARARQLHPGIEFAMGDMRALAVGDEAWAGIVAFYSIIHIPRDEVVQVLGELRRTLRRGGVLLLAFHVGDEVAHLDEWWGQQVSLDFIFFQPQEMAGYLKAAGFEVEEIVERDPYPDREHPSRRAYVWARRPAAAA